MVDIDKAYQNTMGRKADKGGKKYWQKKAEKNNFTQSDLESKMRGIASKSGNSYEANGKTHNNPYADMDQSTASSSSNLGSSVNNNTDSGIGNDTPGGGNSTDYRSEVGDLYQDTLGRSPDKSGLDFWSEKAEKNGLDAVRDQFESNWAAELFEETGKTLRVAEDDQVDGYDYNTSSNLVDYGSGRFSDRLSDYYQNQLGNGKYTKNINSLGQSVYESQTGGQYAFDNLNSNNYDFGINDLDIPETTVTPNQTVQGRIDAILGSDSPMLDRIRNQANQASNARGLLNSSMAQQAAEGAVIDRATQIASQDAETFFRNNQANAGRDMENYLTRLQYDQSRGLADQAFGFNSQLSSQDYLQNLGLTDNEYENRADLSQQDFEQNLETIASEYDLRSDILEQEGNQAMDKLYGTSLANAWGVMGNNITDIVAQSMQNINQIQGNANLDEDAKTQLIDDIKTMRDEDIKFQSNLYASLSDTLDEVGVFPELDNATES